MSNSVRRSLWLRVVSLSILLATCVALMTIAQQRQSEHFTITYQQQYGANAAAYARLVEESLEVSYDVLMDVGFAILPGRIQVDIIETSSGELGAEYLDIDEDGTVIPHLEIATESVMQDYLMYAYVDSTLEDLVLSTCAHELFHVIQDTHSLQGDGDISEQSFVEPHATAIQEVVVPTANDYLDPALELLLAPDSMAFFERSYDAGVFWVYYLARYGVSAIVDLMDSSARYDGRYAIDHALAAQGTSFFDVWAEFALALATASLPDSDVLATLVPVAQGSGWWTQTRDPAPIPPVTCRSTWKGTLLELSTVNAGNESEYVPTYEDDPIGTDLRVAHAYGIDILEIAVDSTVPMVIQFEGDPETTFRTFIALQEDGIWTSAPFTTSTTAQPDTNTERIRIIITRSEPGTGDYSVTIRPS